MSMLADKTAHKALQLLACSLRYFDRLNDLDMTKEDDWDTCAARNLILGIIESNGYKVISDDGKPTSIKRIIH